MTIPNAVAAVLKELGLYPSASLRTVLIRDGYFAGEKYRFDGGWATWAAGKNVIEVYDDNGKLLKTVAVEATEKGPFGPRVPLTVIRKYSAGRRVVVVYWLPGS